MERDEIFNPGVQVDAGFAQIVLQHNRTGQRVSLPPISYLAWVEDGREFVHCLELDLLADGLSKQEALETLKNVILEQMKSAKEEGTQIYHPAPKTYWDKFYEVRRNRFTQAFLDTALTRREIKVRDLTLTHA